MTFADAPAMHSRYIPDTFPIHSRYIQWAPAMCPSATPPCLPDANEVDHQAVVDEARVDQRRAATNARSPRPLRAREPCVANLSARRVFKQFLNLSRHEI
eukprot:4498091-Pyramimonas_sp.AAC.1